jgi:hypothetical protein
MALPVAAALVLALVCAMAGFDNVHAVGGLAIAIPCVQDTLAQLLLLTCSGSTRVAQ